MAALSGKVVIVTGASSGIGEAAARLFAAEGSRVVAAARRLDRLEELRRQIRAGEGEATVCELDVAQPASIEAMVRLTLDTYGRIDVLFNNAGFGRLDWTEVLDPVADIQALINVDLVGAIWTARAVLATMYRQRSGIIINMGSMAGWIAPPLYGAYSAAKFGLRGFTEALRREALPFGVRVCEIFAGGVDTEFGSHVGNNTAKAHFKTPARLRLTAPEVARAVVSLARHPRSCLILPWWMGVPTFLNAHFRWLADALQARALAAYHTTK